MQIYNGSQSCITVKRIVTACEERDGGSVATRDTISFVGFMKSKMNVSSCKYAHAILICLENPSLAVYVNKCGTHIRNLNYLPSFSLLILYKLKSVLHNEQSFHM